VQLNVVLRRDRVQEFMVLRSTKHIKNSFVYDERKGTFDQPFKGSFEDAYELIDFLVGIGDNKDHFTVFTFFNYIFHC